MSQIILLMIVFFVTSWVTLPISFNIYLRYLSYPNNVGLMKSVIERSIKVIVVFQFLSQDIFST